jgi:hypothetical protein
MESFSSASVKRQLLDNSDITGIRKKLSDTIKQDQYDKYVEIGNALELLTETPGWAILETYMMGFVMKSLDDDSYKDLTKGFINLMRYADQMIRFKNDIIAKEKNATTNKAN